jgi:hypothetical protein
MQTTLSSRSMTRVSDCQTEFQREGRHLVRAFAIARPQRFDRLVQLRAPHALPARQLISANPSSAAARPGAWGEGVQLV